MIIKNIKIYNLKIPFSRTIKHRLYARNVTESIIVVIQDDNDNQGMGEGTPREYVTGETLDGSLMAAELISKTIVNQPFETISDLTALLKAGSDSDHSGNHPAAYCAIETAVLDLLATVENKPIYQLFGQASNKNAILYSGVIPSISNVEEFLKYIELVRRLKLKSLKLKVVDVECGISQLKTIREKLGSEIEIRIDANAAFTSAAAIDFIDRVRPIHLSLIEQPVSKNDIPGLKKVSENSDIPIIADESMYTSKGPSYLIDNDICHGLNIRLSSCGGFRKAHDIYQQAKLKNMTIVLGAHVGETAILSFAGRNLAMICADAKYLEGSFSKYVLQEDLADGNVSFGLGGLATIPKSSGLGIAINNSAIEKWSDLYASI